MRLSFGSFFHYLTVNYLFLLVSGFNHIHRFIGGDNHLVESRAALRIRRRADADSDTGESAVADRQGKFADGFFEPVTKIAD